MGLDKAVIGLDIGSTAVHSAVIDTETKLLETRSAMHFGKIWATVNELNADLMDTYDVMGIALTGMGGELAARASDTFFEHDTLTIPRGAQFLVPDVNYVFHIGAKDPYFFEVDPVIGKIDDATGTKCGGGSGLLLDKHFRRCFLSKFPAESDDREALEKQMLEIYGHTAKLVDSSTTNLILGGRCGVIITSDMIHKQNNKEKLSDIFKAAEERVGLNYVIDVVKARDLNPSNKAIAIGGLASIETVIDSIRWATGTNIIVPEHYKQVGAIGTALLGLEQPDKLRHLKEQEIYSFARKRRESIKYEEPLSLEDVTILPEEPIKLPEGKVDVYIGWDGGSTTSKVMVIDAETMKPIYKRYIETEGDSIGAAMKLLGGMKEKIWKHVGEIKGMGFTGSSGAIYELFLTDISKKERSDVLMDEITCHRYGIHHFSPKVDTIFELGGQDAKFTRISSNGQVFSKMNLACFAGTGQAIQNLAKNYGMDVKTSLQTKAFEASKIPQTEGMCAVFSEGNVAEFAAMDIPQDEIAAAIIHAGIGGYVNHFVGNEDIGEYCSAQGGPFLGKAALAMLAKVTGKKIIAAPHRECMGAMGAALAAKKRSEEHHGLSTAFRGFEILDMDLEKRVNNCSELNEKKCKERECEIDVYTLGDETVMTGGLCPIGNTDKSVRTTKKDYTGIYSTMLDKALENFSIGIEEKSEKEVIGIPRSMFFLNENAVFLAAFYNKLGFDVKISPETTDEISALGLKYAYSEECFPLKIAHGHAAYLKDKVDKLLLVNYIGSMLPESETLLTRLKCCPYSASSGFNIKAQFDFKENEILLPVLYNDDPSRKLETRLYEDLKRVYGKKFSPQQVKTAVKFAERKQQYFLDDVHRVGGEFLQKIQESGKTAYVGIGRGYTLFDKKACAETSSLFKRKGMTFIPAHFFDTSKIEIENIVPNMFWQLGRKIVQDSLFVAEQPNLVPVKMTNYGCGPDSFIEYHTDKIFRLASKPVLTLQTDGHSSNAQYGTRIAAFEQNVKEWRGVK